MTNQVTNLYKALPYLLLPISDYQDDKDAIVNLLSFAKLVDEYYIIWNTRVNDEIYVQSKDNRKYP